MRRGDARPFHRGAQAKMTAAPLGATWIFLDFALAQGKINPVPGASSFAKAMED